eukprot:CAMPEP_0204267564 /NCGR_PEP_ID=MMETSP0468-20130131/11032_1 /ASSEMBLY_ACC=CAM_ASM_000383 /TAXON_ID=2969 /ORGANISM="Oxyrrhis marina" /LENGTH=124 /DNA_ID=CAMNT_0051242747 /DNA_START=21 /DNA_END=392 /DNA_ORIENTATION=+
MRPNTFLGSKPRASRPAMCGQMMGLLVRRVASGLLAYLSPSNRPRCSRGKSQKSAGVARDGAAAPSATRPCRAGTAAPAAALLGLDGAGGALALPPQPTAPSAPIWVLQVRRVVVEVGRGVSGA